MDSVTNLTSFVLAGILLNLTPGQDTLYILGRSIAQGRKAGICSVLGISTGALFHISASALGLSAILMTSAVIFAVIKYAGAAYLIYLGIKMFFSKKDNPKINARPANSKVKYSRIYGEGILTNVLNPKVALFFLAFLPQFIKPDQTDGPLPFFFLGSIFLTTGTIWCIIVAVCSSYVTEVMRKKANITRTLDKICGGVFIFLGLKLALEKN
jgi:RhtB (resistance to homoserine/threonine) family protein